MAYEEYKVLLLVKQRDLLAQQNLPNTTPGARLLTRP
jgi:hypothetical protein